MAHGLHWEWRGFGGVSSRMVEMYCGLSRLFEPQKVEDLYLWIPGLRVNAKFRTGAEGGLKFKRIRKKDGDFEKWFENPEELFDFPLNNRAWGRLSEMLKTVNINLSEKPVDELTRERATNLLKSAGCKTVLVKKDREAKMWQAPNGIVKVEWTCITEPQPMISIGLENWEEDTTKEIPDTEAKADLAAAVHTLELNCEALKIMNYMEAVQLWAGGGKF